MRTPLWVITLNENPSVSYYTIWNVRLYWTRHPENTSAIASQKSLYRSVKLSNSPCSHITTQMWTLYNWPHYICNSPCFYMLICLSQVFLNVFIVLEIPHACLCYTMTSQSFDTLCNRAEAGHEWAFSHTALTTMQKSWAHLHVWLYSF